MSTIAVIHDTQDYPWYAIRTKSRLESVTLSGLTGKGYQPYLPTYRNRKQWSDRVVEIDSPLFPGYIFCRFDVKRRLPVLTTPGVMSIVSFGKDPEPVDDSEIEAVRTVLRAGVFSQPCPFLREGHLIRVVGGPLAGLEGILVKKKADWRMVISITMLQRSLSVEIDADWVQGFR